MRDQPPEQGAGTALAGRWGRVLGAEGLRVRLKGPPSGAGVEALAELRIGATPAPAAADALPVAPPSSGSPRPSRLPQGAGRASSDASADRRDPGWPPRRRRARRGGASPRTPGLSLQQPPTASASAWGAWACPLDAL